MNWRSILGIILVGGFVYLLAKGIESGTIGKIEIGNPIEEVKEKISGEKAKKEEKKDEAEVEKNTQSGEKEKEKGKEGEIISSKFGALPSFAEIVEKVSKGVVNISTTRVEEQQNPFWWFFGPGPGPGEEFFRRFFGEPQRRVPTRSLGSGFLVSSDGYIVTNSHVVRGATDINVTLWDGRTFKGKIVGIDEATDIAILKIDATDLPYLKFGDSNELRVGDWVIAIGNPFGLGHTVTVGVVSAKGRSLGITRYEDFIQTDAAINPGNSGGPLINIKGEVVGINTAILNPSGMSVNAGIGFAIPSSLAKDIVPTLIAKGKVERAWLGVYIQEVTPEIAKQLGLKEAKGALVSDVIPGSPADKVGIKRGDVIIEFDGKKVETWRQLPIMVSLSPVNKKAKLKVVRDGKEFEVEVVLAKMPEEQQLARQQPQEQRQIPEQGVELKQFGLTIQDSPDGPKVVSVEPGSPAQMAGIMPGDIIVEVNRKQVKNSSEIANILKDQKSALFLVNREGRTIFVAIRVG